MLLITACHDKSTSRGCAIHVPFVMTRQDLAWASLNPEWFLPIGMGDISYAGPARSPTSRVLVSLPPVVVHSASARINSSGRHRRRSVASLQGQLDEERRLPYSATRFFV